MIYMLILRFIAGCLVWGAIILYLIILFCLGKLCDSKASNLEKLKFLKFNRII